MPSKNIPVNGWPQIKELDTVAPILAELDKIETWQKSVKQETKTGAYVEFTNALALNASSVIAEITAVQDLHGYDKPWVGGAGNNKFDEDTELGGLKWSSGAPADATDRIRSKNFTPILGNTEYYVYRDAQYIGNVSLFFYDSSYNFISYQTKYNNTLTTPNNAAYYKVLIEETTSYNGGVAVNYPSTVTTYSPYTNICPISGFSSVTITDTDSESHTATVTVALGSTVYGGTLDLTSGELIITHGYKDLGTLSWSKDTTTRPADGATIHAFYAGISEMKTVANTDIGNIMCSQYVADKVTSVDYGGYHDVKDGIIGGADTNHRIWVYDSRYNEYSTADFKTAMSGVQIVYELATPTTTTLTAADLEMVKGYNRISANSGNIKVTAYTGNTWN